MQFLRALDAKKNNSQEDILISYDIQSGVYTERSKINAPIREAYCKEIAEIIDSLEGNSLLEVGVGEATTLGNLLLHSKKEFKEIYGFDLSWSRIRYARKYLEKLAVKAINICLVTGDLFNPPFLTNSIDIVYTAHTLEPNGGREKEALEALYRICRKYLILIEPGYELATKEARERMEQHGFVKNLLQHAKDLGYKVIEHKMLKATFNPLNPSGMIVIEKEPLPSPLNKRLPLACPVTKTPLKKYENEYFSAESLLAYPEIKGIGCLMPQNAIIATHFLDDL